MHVDVFVEHGLSLALEVANLANQLMFFIWVRLCQMTGNLVEQ
jgi:hypothetical protein